MSNLSGVRRDGAGERIRLQALRCVAVLGYHGDKINTALPVPISDLLVDGSPLCPTDSKVAEPIEMIVKIICDLLRLRDFASIHPS
jgi:hypothetical protein